MVTERSTRAVRDASARTERLGAWRAVAEAPAMISSLLLLLVVLAHLGRWELPALLGWLGSAAALRARFGERLAVRMAFAFRRPGRAESTLLAPVWATALRCAGLEAAEVDLYVYRSPLPNAVTIGRCSVAVSTGILEVQRVGRLTADELLAVLVHELGHVDTRATKWALPVAWLAAPARLALRALGRVVTALAGRQPRPVFAVPLIILALIAVVQSIDRNDWLTAAVLIGVAAATVLAPLAHAKNGRRSELVADRFAADRSLAGPLSSALVALAGGQPAALRRRDLLASHPTLDERIDVLTAHRLHYLPGAGPLSGGQAAVAGRGARLGGG